MYNISILDNHTIHIYFDDALIRARSPSLFIGIFNLSVSLAWSDQAHLGPPANNQPKPPRLISHRVAIISVTKVLYAVLQDQIVQLIESLQHAFAFSSALKFHPHTLASVLFHIKACIPFTLKATHSYDSKSELDNANKSGRRSKGDKEAALFEEIFAHFLVF